MHALGDWIVTNLVALLALGLAVWTGRRQWLAGREAHISAWFAKTPEGSGMANRLVIVNTGAAEAREINAVFATMAGEPWELRTGGPSPLPLPLLSGGDQLHIPVFIILGTGEYVGVTLSWRDRRRRVQERRTTLSLTGVPLGDASGQVAVERALSDLAREVGSR